MNSMISHHDKEQQEEVRERLTDFNTKLEEIIGDHINGDTHHAYYQNKTSYSNGNSLQFNNQSDAFKKYERDRRQLIERHNEEIAQLKVKIL